jgi:hypothetical protein
MSESITLRLDEDDYWTLQEQAVAERMNLEQYILQELGVDHDDEEVTEFGEFAIDVFDINGERRRENFRRATQYMYEHDERDGSEDGRISREVWVNALREAAREAASAPDRDLDPETYVSSVRAAFYESGFENEMEIREQIADLIDRWNQRQA